MDMFQKYEEEKQKRIKQGIYCKDLSSIFDSIQASCRDSQASINAIAGLGLMSQTMLSNIAAQSERSMLTATAMNYVVENFTYN